MEGLTPPFRRRAYANLCREFIENASGDLIELHERGDDVEDKMTGLKNLAYCLKAPVPYYFCDLALRSAIFVSYFSLPQAVFAAAQDHITIKYANSLAGRVTVKDAFSADLIKRRMPDELKTPAGLEYALNHKLPGLGRLIQRSLP
jgi:hypothetical protein